jgi:hypothetical protein
MSGEVHVLVQIDGDPYLVNMNRHPQSQVGEADHGARPTVVAAVCASGTCPTVYRTAGGTYLVQGRPVDAQSAGIEIPADEALVEIPESLLEQLRDTGRRTG